MEQEIYRKRQVFLFFTCLSFLFVFWWYLPALKYIQYTGIVFIFEGLLLFFILSHLKTNEKEKEFLEGFKQIVPIKLGKDELPFIEDGIYLGEGFIWEQRHAKYVYEKMKDDLTKTLAQVKTKTDNNTNLEGVNFHAVEREKKDIVIPKAEFSGHCCIVATTRAGKTTLLRNIATQLIRAKEPVVIFDPKGEHFLLNSCFEETMNTYGSAEKFSFISSSFPLITDTFNPFKTYVNISDIGDRIASVLPQTGDSAPFVSYSFYMVDVITRCLVYLGENITLTNLKRYSLSPNEWRTLGTKVFQKFFEENNLQIKERSSEANGKPPSLLDNYKYSYFFYKREGYFNEVIENLLGILEQPREHLQKMTSSLIPFFSLLSSDEKPIIFAPDRPSFEWEQIIDKRVVYFFFSSLEAVKTVPLVLKLALQSLISFVGRRQVRGEGGQEPIWLLIDEFGQINYPEFADLLAQAGSSGLKVIMAMQSLSDLEKSTFGSTGGKTVAQRILDNTNIKIFLRNTDNNTAKRLADDIGKVGIPEVARQTTYKPEDLDITHDVNYRTTTNYRDRYLLDPSWTQALPKGEAFIFASGTLFKVKIPLLDKPEKKLLTKEEFQVRDSAVKLLERERREVVNV